MIRKDENFVILMRWKKLEEHAFRIFGEKHNSRTKHLLPFFPLHYSVFQAYMKGHENNGFDYK